VRPFAFVEPEGLMATLTFLREHGDQAKLMAGGQSLLLGLKDRSVRPAYVVSLARIPELKVWRYSDHGELEIGAAVTYARLARVPLQGWHAEIAAVAGNLADRCVRNMGTIGGAACHGDPRFDFPTLLVGLRADVTIAGVDGSRVVSAEDFFDAGGVRLAPSEIVTKFRFPQQSAFSAVAFEKFRYRMFDAALASVSVACARDAEGCLTELRVVVGAVDKSPGLVKGAVRGLIGKPFADASRPEFAVQVAEEIFGVQVPAGRMQRFKFELTKTLVANAMARVLPRLGRET
jgi:aerobic carbon-monoxide dehydrogenase medium subunit